jgi:choline-glycine betaine transporter
MRAAEFLKRRPDGCQSIRQLSRRSIEVMWFDVLYRYDNIGGLMVILSLISMILSVITSNDSGSIVLNTICANGWSKGTSKKEQMIMNMLGIVTIIMTVVGKSRCVLCSFLYVL